jgi:uncharacterized membrane protein YedE/YeeE
MQDLLLHRPAWYVIGGLIGLVVLGLVATINERIGVLGGYSNVYERATGRMLAGRSTVGDGYGWLTRTFDHDQTLVVGGLLVVGGALIGFGAKLAGGCTSGNGLGGCSAGSAASFTATGTFMAVAIASSFVIKGLIS